MSYSPQAVAGCFLANLFCRHKVIAVLLTYWRSQLVPIGWSPPSSTSSSSLSNDSEEQDLELEAFRHGLHVFPGVLIDMELIGQDNAVPAKTDKGTRPFNILRFVFALGNGQVRYLSLDDELLMKPEQYWTKGLNIQPLLTCWATMVTRPQDYWYQSDNGGGMPGHWVFSRFKGIEELGARLYRPSLFILTQAYRLFESLFLQAAERDLLSDEQVDRFFPPFAQHMAEAMEPVDRRARIPWPKVVPEGEKEKLHLLHGCLKLCQLPRDVSAFWEHDMRQLIQEAVVKRAQALYEAEMQRGMGHLPLVQHPKQAVPGEDLYAFLYELPQEEKVLDED